MSNQIALVTGGAGFLGSHVCERLLAEGKDVVCVDNLMTGRRENIAHLENQAGFSFVETDIRDGLPEAGAHEVWNLACPASPPRYQQDPIGTLMINVIGTANVLTAARRWGARVFQASTSEVYGDPDVSPQSESYRGSTSCTGPRACYDEGKRAAETLCFDHIREYGMDVRVVRIFNTYGPRMDPEDGRVVSNFIVKALEGHPLELYGEGHQTRSFCYVDDLVEGFFRLMRNPHPLDGPVNLGNPREMTVRELATIVLGLTSSSSPLVNFPLPVDDPLQRRPDISKAKAELNWWPTVSLEDGLQKTIAYFAAQVEARKVAS